MINLSLVKSRINAYEISDDCFYFFQLLICTDCDAEIVKFFIKKGNGNFKGLCEASCNAFHTACINDLFSYEGKLASNLRFCQQNDLICSKLSDITNSSKTFCKEIGAPLNDNLYTENSLKDYTKALEMVKHQNHYAMI